MRNGAKRVLIDSVASQANRQEEALVAALPGRAGLEAGLVGVRLMYELIDTKPTMEINESGPQLTVAAGEVRFGLLPYEGLRVGFTAAVSHELRSPLTRMRMAIELLPASDRPELIAQIFKDIAELDELIGLEPVKRLMRSTQRSIATGRRGNGSTRSPRPDPPGRAP